MKKRLLICATALTLAISLTGLSGCSGSDNSGSSTADNSDTSEDSTADNADSSEDSTANEVTETKQITCEELTMDLTTDYIDRSSKKTKEIYSFYYSTDTAICNGIRESFDSLKEKKINAGSLDDYVKVIMDKSEITGTPENYNDNTRCITWDKTYNDKDYAYMCFITKSSSAYWMIQFACVKDSLEKFEPKFRQFYDSVSFN